MAINAATESNPTIPLGYDIAWSTFAIVALVLTVTAVVSVVRSDVETAAKVGWSILAVILPVLGALAWFFANRRRRSAA